MNTLQHANKGDWIQHRRLGKRYIKLTYKEDIGLCWYVVGTYKKRITSEVIRQSDNVNIVKGSLI